MSGRAWRFIGCTLPLLACGGGPARSPTDAGTPVGACPAPLGEPAPTPGLGGWLGSPLRPRGPLDGVLRLNHLQVKATHNSYHLKPADGAATVEWDYAMPPLHAQLSEHGVRGLELDVHWNAECGRYAVYHLDYFDPDSSCAWLADCLWEVRRWSDTHLFHHALFVQIEPKDVFDPAVVAERMAALEAELRAVWPPDRVITPDEVQGSAATLSESVTGGAGWPTLGESRGRVLFNLDDTEGYREQYTEGGTTLHGRWMFARVDPGHPLAAVVVNNRALSDAQGVRQAVEAGYLVRTFAEPNVRSAFDGNRAQADSALATGAHILSTNFPTPVEGVPYVLDVPGGAPSRCNPVTAPPECTSEALEAGAP